jgi:hypothetical protein
VAHNTAFVAVPWFMRRHQALVTGKYGLLTTSFCVRTSQLQP